MARVTYCKECNEPNGHKVGCDLAPKLKCANCEGENLEVRYNADEFSDGIYCLDCQGRAD